MVDTTSQSSVGGEPRCVRTGDRHRLTCLRLAVPDAPGSGPIRQTAPAAECDGKEDCRYWRWTCGVADPPIRWQPFGDRPMPQSGKARAVGLNHVALEVGDIEEALGFYARIFAFELRGRGPDMAFIDLGDQFIALQKGRRQAFDDGRHFGLVVDDKDAVRRALEEAKVEPLPGPFLDFLDPWGNRVEVVGYDEIQFSKAPNVLRGMGLTHLTKTERAIEELAAKGMAPLS